MQLAAATPGLAPVLLAVGLLLLAARVGSEIAVRLRQPAVATNDAERAA